MSIVEKMVDAMIVARQVDEECAHGDLLRAAIAVAGLTEAQLEGLANGTMVCVPGDSIVVSRGPIENPKPSGMIAQDALDAVREKELDAIARQHMLAAKEG